MMIMMMMMMMIMMMMITLYFTRVTLITDESIV